MIIQKSFSIHLWYFEYFTRKSIWLSWKPGKTPGTSWYRTFWYTSNWKWNFIRENTKSGGPGTINPFSGVQEQSPSELPVFFKIKGKISSLEFLYIEQNDCRDTSKLYSLNYKPISWFPYGFFMKTEF